MGKIKFNKYVVTSVIFILVITYFGTKIIKMHANELKKITFSNSSVDEKIKKIEKAYQEVPNEKDLLNIYSLEKKISGTSVFEDAECGVIIKDTQGKLHFPYNRVDVTKYANRLIAFNDRLMAQNIPFIYIQCPSKKLKGYTNFPISNYDDCSNECADEFLRKISESNVINIDLREEIIKENIDRSSLFYKTDHHWTTSAAFWANGKIIKVLNEKFAFNIDNKMVDKNNYNFKLYKKCFLGSLGRRVGKYISEIDDYTYIYPKFDTDYEVYYPKENSEFPLWQGNFETAIVRKIILDSKDIEANKHATYFEYEYGNLIIKNKKTSNNKKVLLIKDSFSLPVAAFLSTGVKEVYLVDLRQDDAPKDLIQYVKENGIDVVIVIYNTQVFGDPMFNF